MPPVPHLLPDTSSQLGPLNQVRHPPCQRSQVLGLLPDHDGGVGGVGGAPRSPLVALPGQPLQRRRSMWNRFLAGKQTASGPCPSSFSLFFSCFLPGFSSPLLIVLAFPSTAFGRHFGGFGNPLRDGHRASLESLASWRNLWAQTVLFWLALQLLFRNKKVSTYGLGFALERHPSRSFSHFNRIVLFLFLDSARTSLSHLESGKGNPFFVSVAVRPSSDYGRSVMRQLTSSKKK